MAKAQAVLQLQSGALWHPVEFTNLVGFRSIFHNPYLQLGLKVRISSPSVTSTRLRPLFPPSVSPRGPISSVVRCGCTSLTMTVLYLVSSLAAPETAHSVMLLTIPGLRYLAWVAGLGSREYLQNATSSTVCPARTSLLRSPTNGFVTRRSCLNLF